VGMVLSVTNYTTQREYSQVVIEKMAGERLQKSLSGLLESSDEGSIVYTVENNQLANEKLMIHLVNSSVEDITAINLKKLDQSSSYSFSPEGDTTGLFEKTFKMKLMSFTNSTEELTAPSNV
jgi:hypothetical protein